MLLTIVSMKKAVDTLVSVHFVEVENRKK